MKTKFNKQPKICIFLGCLFVSMLIFSACKTVPVEINPYTKMTWKTEEWDNFDPRSIEFTVENPRWNKDVSTFEISWNFPEANGDWMIGGKMVAILNGIAYPINEMQLISGARSDLRGGQQTIAIDQNSSQIKTEHLTGENMIESHLKYRVFLKNIPEEFAHQSFTVYIENISLIAREGSSQDPDYIAAYQDLVDEIHPGIVVKPYGEYVDAVVVDTWPENINFDIAQDIVNHVYLKMRLHFTGPWVVEYTP